MKKSRTSIIVLACVVLMLVGMGSLAHAELAPGDVAPSLVVKKIDGTTFDLASLKGKVVLVHFWATWCGPCREEMPQITAFYLSNRFKGMDMIALSVDSLHERNQVKDIGNAFKIPVAMMDDAKDGGFGNPPYIPVTFVIDKNGVVQAKMAPDTMPVTFDSLSAVVSPLLGTGHSK